MFRSYQITPRVSIVKVIVRGTIFSATQLCNVETMLSLLQTMSQRCGNAVLRYKSSLRIVSCNITFSETANPQKKWDTPPFLKKKKTTTTTDICYEFTRYLPFQVLTPPPPPANIVQSL